MEPLLRKLGTIRDNTRAWTRLLAFLSITAATVVFIRIRRALAGDCPRATARIGQKWARLLIRSLGVEMQVRGQLPAEPALIVANHRSYIDIAALLSQHPCTFLAKKEIGEWPVLGTAARLNRTVFVDRECKESRRRARESARATLAEGIPFAAFPEGTTTRGPGTLPFCSGLFHVAAEGGHRVTPVAIEYGERDDAWVDDDSFLDHFIQCFGKKRVYLNLIVGPTLEPDDAARLHEFSERWIRRNLVVPSPVSSDESSDEFPEILPDLFPV